MGKNLKKTTSAAKRPALKSKTRTPASPARSAAKPARTTSRKVLRSKRPVSAPTAKGLVSELEIAARKYESAKHAVPDGLDLENLGELPEAYGTRRVWMSARDPYWLYCYWDLSWQQYHEYCGKAHDGKLFLKIFESGGHEVLQAQIHDHMRSYYYHAQRPTATFFAEVGYYRHGDQVFEVIGRSGSTTTPRDNLSPNNYARFATIPFNWSFRDLLELIKNLISENEELAEAIARLQETGHPFPFKAKLLQGEWTPEQEKALVDYLGEDVFRRIWMGSFEVTEWLRRRLLSDSSSFIHMSSPGVSSWSSPFGASFGQTAERSFWMNVNAELIIYGATDPGAELRIAGKNIDIRKDGTFSFHWSFPDGIFHIPIEAVSPDKVEKRGALLSFLRTTSRSGEVTDHPQDAKFQEPMGKTA